MQVPVSNRTIGLAGTFWSPALRAGADLDRDQAYVCLFCEDDDAGWGVDQGGVAWAAASTWMRGGGGSWFS